MPVSVQEKEQEGRRIGTFRLILQCLEVSQQAAVFLAAAVAAYFGLLNKPDREIGMCLLIVVLVVFAYLCRHLIRRFWLFMASHVLMAAAAFYAGNTDSEVFVYVLVVGVLAGYSIRLKNIAVQQLDESNIPVGDGGEEMRVNLRMRSLLPGEHMSIYFIAVMAIGYFAGISARRQIIMNMEVILSILFIILQIVYNNVRKLYQVFSLNGGKSEFPVWHLKHVTMYITAAAVIFVLAGMLLFYNGSYGNIFSLAGKGIMQAVRLLLAGVLFIWGLFGSDGELPPENEPPAQSDGVLQGGSGMEMTDSPIMEALAEAFGVMLTLVIAVGLVYLICVYIKNFNRARSQGQDYIENVKPRKKSYSRVAAAGNDRTVPARENRSVRKMYKKLVLRGSRGEAPDKANAPARLTLEHITSDTAQADRITAVYEKARYSDETISEEDIRFFKNLY